MRWTKGIIGYKEGFIVEPYYSKFKIGKTSWIIALLKTEDSKEEEFYRVYKNGMAVNLCNGNDYETEAEINILIEYRVKNEK